MIMIFSLSLLGKTRLNSIRFTSWQKMFTSGSVHTELHSHFRWFVAGKILEADDLYLLIQGRGSYRH